MKCTLLRIKNKVNIKELIVFSPVTMHASKRDVIAINYLLHEGLKTIDEVVKETINSHNPLVMYYVALFVDGITDDHLQRYYNAKFSS